MSLYGTMPHSRLCRSLGLDMMTSRNSGNDTEAHSTKFGLRTHLRAAYRYLCMGQCLIADYGGLSAGYDSVKKFWK